LFAPCRPRHRAARPGPFTTQRPPLPRSPEFHLPTFRQVSLLHHTEPSEHSVSNHPPSPPHSVCFPPGLTALEAASWASPVPSRLATTTGRDHRWRGGARFLIVRTARSPPVASHPSSRRRSYFRLQGPNQALAGTYTPLTRCARRRTGCCHKTGSSRPCAGGCRPQGPGLPTSSQLLAQDQRRFCDRFFPAGCTQCPQKPACVFRGSLCLTQYMIGFWRGGHPRHGRVCPGKSVPANEPRMGRNAQP